MSYARAIQLSRDRWRGHSLSELFMDTAVCLGIDRYLNSHLAHPPSDRPGGECASGSAARTLYDPFGRKNLRYVDIGPFFPVKLLDERPRPLVRYELMGGEEAVRPFSGYFPSLSPRCDIDA